jgi:hypothetical protein
MRKKYIKKLRGTIPKLKDKRWFDWQREEVNKNNQNGIIYRERGKKTKMSIFVTK